ncbi:MAG: ribonuclease P protein component [Alistipes sp.]|nr:ribonuclease P protein component [Alistipes sp.]
MKGQLTLPKRERLCSFGALRRLFGEGKGGFVYPLRYVVYVEGATDASAEVLFSTPKKFLKRANKRNVMRRRMREAYRLNKEILLNSGKAFEADIALIYSSKEVLDYQIIENAIKKILRNIVEQM